MRLLYERNTHVLDTDGNWLVYVKASGDQYKVWLSLTRYMSEIVDVQNKCCKPPVYLPPDLCLKTFEFADWDWDDNPILDIYNGENRTVLHDKWGIDIMFPGTMAGTMDYNELTNKPSINGVILENNKSFNDLGLLTWLGF